VLLQFLYQIPVVASEHFRKILQYLEVERWSEEFAVPFPFWTCNRDSASESVWSEEFVVPFPFWTCNRDSASESVWSEGALSILDLQQGQC
jgi:hypothetical protein